MNYLCKISIKKIFFLIKNKKITNYELTKLCLNNLIKINKKNNFVNEIFYKESLIFSKKNDKLGNVLIPISIKNIFNLKNKICNCNSKILNNYVSKYDSFIIKILKKNNFNILSLDKLDEFCVGSCGLNNSNAKNLYNKKFIVGGSSWGSALNISFSCNFLSIGSDTGGSIRTPSSYCNLISFKPTNGIFSRYGMIPYSSLIDNCSIISNNVEDCEFLYKILKIKNNDLFSNKKKIFFLNNKKKISIINYKEFFINFEVKNLFDKIIKKIEKIGFKIIQIKKNFFSYNNIYDVFSSKEFYSNSSKFEGLKYGIKKFLYKNNNDFFKSNRFFSKENKNKILKGNFYNDLKYNYNSNDINNFKNIFKTIFLKSNFLLIPTNIKHFKKNEKFFENIDLLTTFSNILGYPTINLKLGKINHLPFGFQIISEKNIDLELINFSKIIESFNFNNYVYN